VDLFLAPSEFLLERYVDWGLPREKLRFEDYGRIGTPLVDDVEQGASRDKLGFFGQVNPFKGVTILLKAMAMLEELVPTAHLWIHGANLKLQTEAFQEEFKGLLDEADENVTYAGPYRPEETTKMMAGVDWIVVPSVWWENSPLVIQEAFMSRRPVVCSDIGGMAEKVEDGVNGLHFRTGDPASLAMVLHRALSTQGLWDQLRTRIPEVFGMETHIDNLMRIYQHLHAERNDAVAAG
jgi:glycosyltransferase involved in cell wall biosynthesis